MAETVVKLKGVYTYPSEITEVPDGALAVGDNIVIDRDSIAEPRPGFNNYAALSASIGDRGNQLLTYRNRIIAQYNSVLKYDTAGTLTAYSGTYSPPSHGDSYVPKIKGATLNSNFYFTTSDGIKRLDSVTGTPIAASAPQGLDANLSLTGSSGFMTNNTEVAYRMLWGYKDANNNLILGAPSQRAVIANASGGTRDVIINFSIPSNITTSWFFQIYRSSLSASSSTDPADDLQLVYEANPTSGEISAKVISVTDSTPDSLRGAALYTNAAQQGIGQANLEPPSAKDIAAFKNCMFYANTIRKQNLTITLLSASVIQVNDTVTINGVVYTADSSENTATGHFMITTGGTPAQNIAATAQSLVKVINRYATNTGIYAYYLSGATDLPGKIYLETRSLSGVKFSVISSAHGTAWNPQLPTVGTTVSSAADQNMNYLYFSKIQQPDAVPLLNFFPVGSGDSPIYRILPLRDSLIIMKEDGVFRLTGNDPATFSVEILDLTVRVLAPETACKLNNQIYALTNQGATTITDTGVGIISRPIEGDLTSLFQFSNLATTSFAVGFESARKYILFVPTNSSDAFASRQHVYNTFTQAWTTWSRTATSAIVNPGDDKLYFTNGSNNEILQQRKAGDYTDNADESIALTVTAFSGLAATVTDASLVSINDAFIQGGLPFSYVTSVDAVNNIITIDMDRGYAAGAATAYKAFTSTITWTPLYCKNPAALKQIRDIELTFKQKKFDVANLSFTTNLSPSPETITITGAKSLLWGYFKWGSIPWGGIVALDRSRTLVPSTCQRCSWLNVTFKQVKAFGSFGVSSLTLYYDDGGERTSQ